MKDRNRSYRPARTHRTKVRTRTTSEAIVGGVIGSLRTPEALVLGRVDERRVAGRTTPLTLPARRELGALLQPPHGGHPWPERISSGRFGQLPPEPVPYVQVEPLLVVEVDADVCFELDRWRHATVYRRLRAELRPEDLSPTANRGPSWRVRPQPARLLSGLNSSERVVEGVVDFDEVVDAGDVQ